MADRAAPATDDNISESSTLLKTSYPKAARSITRIKARRKAKGFGSRQITSTPPTTRAFARKTGGGR